MKTAVITGVSGQDGSYLAEFLLDHDYRVFGLYRRTSNYNLSRINHLLNNAQFKLLEFDLTDPSSINNIIKDTKPDEFYNLAAQSHVATSFNQPITTVHVNTKLVQARCLGITTMWILLMVLNIKMRILSFHHKAPMEYQN